MAELIVKSAEGLVTRHPLGTAAITVGRHPECDIVIGDPLASRRHARVQSTPKGVIIEDLKSANGTLLNGQPLTGSAVMKDGDRFSIGSVSVELQVTPKRPETRGSTTAPPPGAKPVEDAALSVVTFSEDSGGAKPAVDFAVDAERGALAGVHVGDEADAHLKKISMRLETMVKLSEALATTLDVRDLLEGIMDRLTEIFPQYDRGFILLANPGDEAQLMPQVIRNREAKVGEASAITVSSSVIREARTTRKSVLVSDTGMDTRFAAALSIARFQIRSVMCTPLIATGEDMGVIYLDTKSREKAFSPDDLALFTAVAAQAAVSLKVARLAVDAARQAQIRSRFERYFPPDMVEKMVSGEIQAEPGGQLKRGTVFFSDIIGFSKMASLKKPSDVIALLNRYFKVMEEVIFRHNGTIDKFGGDAIMAFWGVLVELPHPAYHAALAAMDMQNALYGFNWQAQSEGTEPIWMGIGLNTGEFVAGNIGSEQMVEYTVIGEAVNLAQRVESLAGRGQVFVAGTTLEEFRQRAVAVALPPSPVKGYAEPVEVFSIRGLVSPDAERRVAHPEQTTKIDAPVLQLSIPASFRPKSGPAMQGFLRAGEISGSELYLEGELPGPMEPGEAVAIWPAMQELTSMPPFEAKVVDRGIARSDELGERHVITFRVASPNPMHKQFLRPGSMIPSDLAGPEAMVRA